MADTGRSPPAPADESGPPRRRWPQSAALLLLLLIPGVLFGPFLVLSPQEGRSRIGAWLPIATATPAEQALERGNRAFQRGDYSEAIRHYTAALAENANSFDAYFNRGLAHSRRFDYAAAIKDFTRALEIDAEANEARLARGHAYLDHGNPQLALADFEDAIRRQALNYEAIEGRGWALHALGRYEAALADFEKAVAVAPKFAEGHNALAWLLATCPDDRLRNGKRAIEHASKALALATPADPRHYDTLAAAHAELGDFAKAVAYAEKALAGTDLSPKERGAFEARLALYRGGKPYRGN